MISAVVPDPDQQHTIIFVGQDAAGRWIVQERERQLEGRFVSREVAWSFARAERHGFPGAQVIAAAHTLVPSVVFASRPARENVFPRAA